VTPPPAEAGGVVPNFAPSIPPVAEATGVPAKFVRTLGRPIDSRGAAVLFIVGQAAVSLPVLVAFCMYQGFSFWDGSLSDLGMGATAPLFNGGLVVGGILSIVFYGALWVKDWKGMGLPRKAGAVLQPLSLGFMLNVGIFTESFGRFHFYLAVAFFVLLTVGTFLLGLSMVRDPEVRFPGFVALVIVIIGAASWFIPRGDGLAIPEVISSLPYMVWMSAMAVRRLRGHRAGGPRHVKRREGAEEE